MIRLPPALVERLARLFVAALDAYAIAHGEWQALTGKAQEVAPRL